VISHGENGTVTKQFLEKRLKWRDFKKKYAKAENATAARHRKHCHNLNNS